MLNPAQSRFNALLKHIEEGVRIQTRLISQPDPDALLEAATGLAPFWDALEVRTKELAPEELGPFQTRLERLRSATDSNASAAAKASASLRTELHEISRTLLRLRQILRGTTQNSEDAPRTLWA